jgi:hypothetical protein
LEHIVERHAKPWGKMQLPVIHDLGDSNLERWVMLGNILLKFRGHEAVSLVVRVVIR